MGRLGRAAAAALLLVLAGVACSEDKPHSQATGGTSGAAAAGTTAGSAGDDDSGAASGGGGTNVAGGDFAEAYCAAARACCMKDKLDAAGLASCEADAREQFDTLKEVARGTVLQVEPAFGECIVSLEQLAESCIVADQTFEGCNQAYAGTVPSGDACRKVVDCQRSAETMVCLKVRMDGSDVDPELGVCRPLARAAVDEPCLLSGDAGFLGVTYTTPDAEPPLAYCSIDDQLYCKFPEQVCTPRGAATASCNSSEECQGGLGCVDDSCQPLKAQGEPCVSFEECAAGTRCQSGHCELTRFANESLCGGDLN